MINIDAHLDCRKRTDSDQVHSGCPYRIVQESGVWREDCLRVCGNTPHYVVFGCQGHACAAAHVEYVRQNGGSTVWLRDIRAGEEDGVVCSSANQHKHPGKKVIRLCTQAGKKFYRLLRSYEDSSTTSLPVAGPDQPVAPTPQQPTHLHQIYVSFDLDSIRASDCPGVSAPSVAGGLTSEEAMEIALVAGLDSRVRMFCVSEFSPEHDVGGITAKLAANMVYYHLLGWAARNKDVVCV